MVRAQVVVVDGNRVLLACHRRGQDSYWVLPGGAVEADEGIEDAARREMLEETGLTVRLERLLFVEEPREDGVVRIKSARHTFLASVVGGALCCGPPVGGSEAKGFLSDVRWMPLESPLYDGETRDTLGRVQRALGIGDSTVSL